MAKRNLPQINLSKVQWTKTYTPILMILLIVAAFLLGMLITKVQYLEKGGYVAPSTTGSTGAQQAAPSGPLHVAKAIGMDEKKFADCVNSGKYTKQVAQDLADGQQAGVQGTPAVFIDGQAVIGAQPYSAFSTVIDQEIQNPNAPLPSGTRVNVSTGTYPVMGNQNAPVTIVEFADFQCPFCEKFFTDTEGQIINNYVKTGKAKFAFRNYSFLGADSNTLAEGAYCAQEQNKFWQYHDFIYSHQGQENTGWASKTNLL